MSMPASFLGGAGDRLLPVSVPFRFFLTAAGFHVLAWGLLLIGADELGGFSGGPGYVLAAIHILTLGVLAMTAIGASYQLLPIATRQALLRVWPARLSYWLLVLGIPVLAYGMIGLADATAYLGGGLVCAGLIVFAALTAENLRRANSMPIVAAHGWGAMVALLVLAGLGLVLILDFDLGILADHQGWALIHMIVASFGFMGLLVLGFSQVLIPMFVLSRALPPGPGWAHLGLSLGGLVLFSAGVVLNSQVLQIFAGCVGFLGALVYVWLMRGALKTAMRRRQGISFILIKGSWGGLVLALAIGLVELFEVGIPNGAALFGFTMLVGWLLTFLLGILQRIMPFLASMHVQNRAGKPPLLSELTPELPAKIHLVCHFLAFSICFAGIILDAGSVVRLGAAIGFAGSLAFLAFAGTVVFRLSSPNS